MAPNQQPVTVSLHDLQSGEASNNISEEGKYLFPIGSVRLSTLEEAFGEFSLGILIVKDLPTDFQPLRIKLLSYASYLGQLSQEQLGRD
jgi:hypothetical protein